MACSALQLISTQRATGPLLEGLRRPQRPDVRRWNMALWAYPRERETPRRLAQALRQRLVDVHARRRDRDFAAAVRSPACHHGLVRGGAVPQLAEGAGLQFHTYLMRRISAMRRSDGVSQQRSPEHRACVLCTAVLPDFRQRLSPQRSPGSLSARYGVLGARTDATKLLFSAEWQGLAN